MELLWILHSEWLCRCWYICDTFLTWWLRASISCFFLFSHKTCRSFQPLSKRSSCSLSDCCCKSVSSCTHLGPSSISLRKSGSCASTSSWRKEKIVTICVWEMKEWREERMGRLAHEHRCHLEGKIIFEKTFTMCVWKTKEWKNVKDSRIKQRWNTKE